MVLIPLRTQDMPPTLNEKCPGCEDGHERLRIRNSRVEKQKTFQGKQPNTVLKSDSEVLLLELLHFIPFYASDLLNLRWNYLTYYFSDSHFYSKNTRSATIVGLK